MKKKWLIPVMILVAVTIINVTFIYGKLKFNLENSKKENGIKQVQENILVDLPSKKDKQAVVDSIDPKTGAPTLNLEAKADEKEVLKKKFTTEDTGNNLDIPYVTNGEKDVAIYDPVTTIQAVPIPGTDEYLVNFDSTIYITDWKNGKLKKFLKDEVKSYKKDDFMKTRYDQAPIWGYQPLFNPSGKYVLFQTNRCMANGDYNGETWVKDMDTGDEKPVISGCPQIIGWIDDATPVFSGQQIFAVNIKTLEKKILCDEQHTATFAGNHIAFQDNPGSITLIAAFTGQKTVVVSPLLNEVHFFSGRGPWVGMLSQIKGGALGFSIVLYNIDTKIWKVIAPPDNILIDSFTWKDDSTILIRNSIIGTMEETTYVVNINDVEEAVQ